MSEQGAVLTYYCDSARHLVCVPFSLRNLHQMAVELDIHRCWFHNSPSYPHYDIPKRRIAEVKARCTVVRGRDILAIIKGTYVPPGPPPRVPLVLLQEQGPPTVFPAVLGQQALLFAVCSVSEDGDRFDGRGGTQGVLPFDGPVCGIPCLFAAHVHVQPFGLEP